MSTIKDYLKNCLIETAQEIADEHSTISTDALMDVLNNQTEIGLSSGLNVVLWGPETDAIKSIPLDDFLKKANEEYSVEEGYETKRKEIAAILKRYAKLFSA